MAETIVIPFEGAGSGECELTWGQRHILDWIETSGAPLSMTAVQVLDEGAKVDESVDVLRYFMNRFQAMRTRLSPGPAGRPRQSVASSGEVTLEIVDADNDPAATAEAVVARHQATHFDYFHEWPVRMTLVRHDGALTHLVTTLCHLVFDAAAAMVMFRDLQARATGPVTGITPLALAAWQASPAGERQNAAALRYWERELRSCRPLSRGPDGPGKSTLPEAPPGTGAEGCWELEYDSPAISLAARSVAARLGADTRTVLLTAYAVALARVTGRSPRALEIIVSNRFRPGYADSVSPVNQTGLCVLDLDGVAFSEAVELVRRRTFTAYKHAYFDPDRQRDLIARVSEERGGDLGLGYFVNDRRTQLDTAPEIRAARSGLRRLDTFNKRLMVYFSDAPTVMLQADARHVPPDTMAALARELEAVLVTEAG